MPIRTKTVTQYYTICQGGQGGGSTCSVVSANVDVPIRDWRITPSQLNKIWQMGTATPGQLFQDITFPELEFVYSNYANFRFKLKKNINSVDFANITSSKLVGDTFNQTNLVNERIFCSFQNLDNLSAGTHVIPVVIEAYGLLNNQENFLESFYTEISITVQAGTGIPTDKNVYNLKFNKADDSLSGDIKIIAFATDPITITTSDPFINLLQESVNSQRHLTFQNNSVLQSKVVGNYSGTVNLQIGSYTKNVVVNLEVMNDATLFYVNPTSLNFSLQKNLSEIKVFDINLLNPNNLNIVVDSSPSFIESADIVGGILKITTINASALSVGNYSGEVLLKAGTVIKKVLISISVIESIKHDFSGSLYFFAKDRNKVTITKTTSSSTYVKMTLEMYFKGFDEQYQESQKYTFPFFQGKTEFYPGIEIHDFFIKAKNVANSLDPVYQYDLALVNMVFEEMNDLDQVVSTFNLDNLYFAPGKKPKCFPLFTDHNVRSTYSDSILKINVDRLTEKDEINKIYQQYNGVKPSQIAKFTVDQFTFLRNNFKEQLRTNVIESNEMIFLPIPDPEKTIHIEWENQNLVFEWFTGSGYLNPTAEIEHLIGESKDFPEEKFDSEKSRPLTVNSGWILKEEITLIDDILASRLCFIYSEGKRYKAFPIGKKNELKGEDNTLCMEIDFKILE